MNRWLETFPYRIDLSLIPFVAAALTSPVITWLIAGGLAAKATCDKPSLAYRYE